MQHAWLLPGKHALHTWPLSKPAICHVHLLPQHCQQQRLKAMVQNSSAEQQSQQQSQRAFKESVLEPGSVVQQILSDPGVEGDALKFLKVTDAYWSVSANSCQAQLLSFALGCKQLLSAGPQERSDQAAPHSGQDTQAKAERGA